MTELPGRRRPSPARTALAIVAVLVPVVLLLAAVIIPGSPPAPGVSPSTSPRPSPSRASAGPTAHATGSTASLPATANPSGTTASPPSATAAFDPTHVALALRQVASGLQQPVFVTGAGDSSGRLFVVEQTGRIRIVKGGQLLATPFLDVSSLIVCCGEQGLLGLAFHPGYARDGRFYVYYTSNAANHDVTIAEYRRSTGDPDRADPGSARILLQVAHGKASNHDGGMLVFGPDGRLYAGLGDGGGANGQFGTSRDLGTLLAKIIRLDVDHPAGGLPYGTTGNPFAAKAGARPEIWAWGLRNPWRFSFDRSSGDLWIGDVGQDRWEEIDHAPAGVGGQDYGWNEMEGFHCFPPASDCVQSGLTLPVAEYGHDVGCAVVGGYVYRGAAYQTLLGGYLFGDDCSGRVWALVATASGRQTPVELLSSGLSISSFGEDDAGELYLTDVSGGGLYAISAAAR